MHDRQPYLVFDLDDTLFLERDYVRTGFEAVGNWAGKQLGVHAFGERAWQLFQEGHREHVFDFVLKESGHEPSPKLIEEMVSVYRTHRPRISVLPDAIKCLASFHGKTKLALITDGPLAAQERKVRALRLKQWFDLVVFTDRWGNEFSKPHRRAFEYVQSRVKPDGRGFIYIGDNPKKDFSAPLALGWKTVRVRRLQGLHFLAEAPAGTVPDIEMADLSGLSGFVARNATHTKPTPWGTPSPRTREW
jgi:putative hydrolase of the HAD superfamily